MLNIKGRGGYASPKGYNESVAVAEEYDKEFPLREKHKLPGQMFE